MNFDLPNVPETYVHRIGRTARAGAEGVAISLCDGEEVAFLRDIEKLIRITIPVSDRRAEQRREEPRVAGSAFIKSPANAKRRRHSHHGGLARKQSRHATKRGAARIDSVAFIHGKHRPERDRASRAQRWAGHSKGT